MSPETQSADPFAAARLADETVACPSCRAELPRGLRFCRLCGYRLGEGVAEYVETVRFDGMPLTPPAAPLANFGGAARGFQPINAATTALSHPDRRRKKLAPWLMWPLVGVAIITLSGGAVVVKRFGGFGDNAGAAVSHSFFGAGDFTEVDGAGVMLEAVSPGGPAETAGLRDGDIVTTFDGRRMEDEDDLRRALRATPVGKSVPVEFVRDGELKTVTLVTISPDAYDARAFVPPAGEGFWGVSSLRRVRVPGTTNLHGVRLGSVSENRPADLAGLKEDDIVVEFNGQPVRTTDGLGSYIDHAAPGTVVNVTVIRDGQRVEIPVKMGRE